MHPLRSLLHVRSGFGEQGKELGLLREGALERTPSSTHPAQESHVRTLARTQL
jgi:hypothetical protein